MEKKKRKTLSYKHARLGQSWFHNHPVTSLLFSSFSFSFPFCLSLPLFLFSALCFCPLSFLHLPTLHFLHTNLSSILFHAPFQSSLSPLLFWCAPSSHSFAHFIRSRCTSKLHKSCACCVSLSFFLFSAFSFVFLFLYLAFPVLYPSQYKYGFHKQDRDTDENSFVVQCHDM